MFRMLDPNPKTRATIAEIRLHPWINEGFVTPPPTCLPEREPIRVIKKEILSKLESFGFDEETARRCLLNDEKTSQCYVIYHLLLDNYIKNAKKDRFLPDSFHPASYISHIIHISPSYSRITSLAMRNASLGDIPILARRRRSTSDPSNVLGLVPSAPSSPKNSPKASRKDESQNQSGSAPNSPSSVRRGLVNFFARRRVSDGIAPVH
jgi:hypothetical protein